MSFCATYALCRVVAAQPGPALLSALLAMSLGRAQAFDRKHLALAPLVIAATSLAAGGVAWLLVHFSLAGAAIFVLGIFTSIYLRNFGAAARRAGSLLAMPLAGILIAPARADAPGGPLIDFALIVAAGLVAFGAHTITHAVALRLALQAPVTASAAVGAGTTSVRALTPTTRLALQMAVALIAAFVTGFTLFPGHWGWTVLTAFIVGSGARGRGDVAYKSLQRLGGAFAGTLTATLLTYVWRPDGVIEALAIFAILYAGFALRPVNYAYWAASMTLVLALLVPGGVQHSGTYLALRLAAILTGGLCAVAAAWFVFPIKTTSVVRKRLAEALRALDDVVAHAHLPAIARVAELARFDAALAELDRIEAPVRFHRRALARRAVEHPALWIEQTRALGTAARDLDARSDERRRAALRKAIGTARRAIGAYETADPGVPIGVALAEAHAAVPRA